MSKILVIVESPAKIQKIEGFLGNKYKVLASYGHINNLGKNRKDLGIDITNNYKPSYYLSADKIDIVNKLREASKKAKYVIIASDQDAEGEAIGYHLCNILNLDLKTTKRIVFNSITKDEILKAIKNPSIIDINLVKSQQTRQILDKLIGYSISPTLWKQIGHSLSAGRCQSPAIQLLHDKENDINELDQSTHYKINGIFNKMQDSKNKIDINGILSNNINDKKSLNTFLDNCKKSKFSISNIKKSKETNKSSAPFITSTLQQECYNKFNMSSKSTMSTAQKLYEKGHITYHRTDSTILSNDADIKIKKFIISNYGDKYYNKTIYKNKKVGKVEEAHECIRPVKIELENIKSLNTYETKLYNIIWKRTIASQMSNLEKEINKITIDISNDKNQFISKFEEILFDGYTKVYSIKNQNVDIIVDDEIANSLNILKELNIGTNLNYNIISADEKFDKSVNHYSESSLIKELEKKGIGRPSTYSNIMESIQKRNYVVKESREGIDKNVINYTLKNNKILNSSNIIKFGKENNKLYITDLGKMTTLFLIDNFPDLMNYDYTSKIELDLDKISDNKKIWYNVIDNYYKKIEPQVTKIKENITQKKFKKILGKNSSTGDEISIIIGKYGPVIKSGCYKDASDCKFAAIKDQQNISSTTINDAQEQLSYPLNLGKYLKKDVIIKNGPYGYYISYNNKNYNIKSTDITELKLKNYIDIIKNTNSNIIKEFKDFKIIEGKYGPYIHNLNDKSIKKFIKLPSGIDLKNISLENIQNIIKKI
jgi:DNA topoisomerase-1